MFDATNIALFLAAATTLAVTPGPGIFYVASRTVAGGRAEGISSSLGNGIGGMAHVAAGSAGVAALVLASAELFAALKWIGVVYLIWLGVRTYRAAGASADVPALQASGSARAFREGIVVELLNPKTAAFFLAFIPQFIDPSRADPAMQFAVLGTISVALNTAADIAVAYAASSLRMAFATNSRTIRRLRQASAFGLISLGFGLALAKRPGG